jgi:hypothetical protein
MAQEIQGTVMRDEWFCSGPQGRVGPLTFEQLKHSLRGNLYANHIFIWHETLPDWVRVCDFRGLAQPDQADRFRRGVRPIDSAMDVSRNRPLAEKGRGLRRRRFSILGLSVGLLIILLGCAVFYMGVSGEFTLASELFDANSVEIDASVGVVLLIVGIIVIWATRRAQ